MYMPGEEWHLFFEHGECAVPRGSAAEAVGGDSGGIGRWQCYRRWCIFDAGKSI